MICLYASFFSHNCGHGEMLTGGVGAYQVVAGRCFRDDSHHERTVEYRYLAGDLVLGVPGESALAESCCDDSG